MSLIELVFSAEGKLVAKDTQKPVRAVPIDKPHVFLDCISIDFYARGINPRINAYVLGEDFQFRFADVPLDPQIVSARAVQYYSVSEDTNI